MQSMSHNGSSSRTAYFAIRNEKSLETLVEVSLSYTSLPSVAKGECDGVFSNALAFIAEAQSKSYDFFGRNMLKNAEEKANTTPGRCARKTPYGDTLIAEDCPSSSFLDSAEWEDTVDKGDDGYQDSHNEKGTDQEERPTKKSKR